MQGAPLEDASVNPYPPGDAAARALWAAGGRYYMQDPETGEWIGPDSLDEIINPDWRRQSMLLEQALGGSDPAPSPAGDQLDAMIQALMAAIASGAVPPEAVTKSPNLRFLWANFRQQGGGAAASPGLQPPEEEQGDQGCPK